MHATYETANNAGYRYTYFRGRMSGPDLCARTRAELAQARRDFHALINEPPSRSRHMKLAYQLGVLHALARLIAHWSQFPHLNA